VGEYLTTPYYNAKIILRGIPLEAYEYVVNGKPALEWVMGRQGWDPVGAASFCGLGACEGLL
jgi:predicted helicase